MDRETATAAATRIIAETIAFNAFVSFSKAAELIEAGFEYVCEIDGIKLFRKRK